MEQTDETHVPVNGERMDSSIEPSTDPSASSSSSTIGALERIAAHLSRVEHGDGRAIIGRARAELTEQASTLLVLRARSGAAARESFEAVS